MDDRRKALEEDYFRRKDKESLQKLRDALQEAARERGEDIVTMNCPRCSGRLHEFNFDDVNVDRCDTCGGIWLDSGELEQIVNQETAAGRWFRVFWPGKGK